MSTKEEIIQLSASSLRNESVIFPNTTQPHLALQDLQSGIKNWRIWLILSYQDIKLRYRRSVLGPFWITISMAITVYSMGYLYSHLFHTNMNEYFPYLVAGMLGWSLISTTIIDMVDTFNATEGMIKQIKLPYSLYIHRVVARNILIFMHNILVIIPVMILFPEQMHVGLHLFLLIPGLIILYINAFCYGAILAIIGARYRDISQIVKSLVQVIFFVTPIMWKPDVIPPSKQFIAFLNPFYSYLELIRAPLIGYFPTFQSMGVILITTLIGLIVSYFLFVSRRARIIYWL